MSLSSVKLGTSFNKKYTHNLDFDNNTTMDFGSVQPLLCQYLLPKSDVNLNYRQLIRLAPMPTPSFARIFAKNYARFVPMTDVVEYHEAFLSNKPYYSKDRSFIPAYMPFTENRVLQYMLLSRSQWSVYLPVEGQPTHYEVYNTGSNYESDYNRVMASFYAFVGLGSQSLRPLQQSLFLNNLMAVSLEESDYIVPVYNNAGATDLSQPDGLIVFRFSDEVKRLRKVFVGLGYGLSLDDSNPVSLAPLLAFYKAYYDTFGMTRDKSFESTPCYNLIRHISNYDYDYSMDMYAAAKPSHSPLNIQGVFEDFISSLGKMFYSSADNFLAAHRLNPMNNASLFAGKNLLEANGNKNADFVLNKADITMPGVRVGGQGMPNHALIQQLTLDVLKRISRFVSKDSVIGYRISDWVKVHYGADVVSSLFEESNFIHQSSTPVDISDVFSTSDTADIANLHRGEYLGAYAGKGIGFNKNGFTFHSPCHGYLFVFSCVVPVVRDFVGSDPTLYSVTSDEIPVPEFDALGYELTQRAACVGDNFIASHNEFPDKAFGFVPRYSGYKVKKDVVNGDMYLGYFKRDLQPYYLDRIPYNNHIKQFNRDGQTSYHLTLDMGVTPSASTAWQSLDGNSAVGNFNRLFYDEGKPSDQFGNTDKFIVQTVFSFKVRNYLKPISDSYDTYDENVDTSSTNVSTN
nr:MAG: major capsid protein [Microviridae sp.]